MNPVLEFCLWFCVGIVIGIVLGKVQDRWPHLFRKDGWNFWDSVIVAFFLYGLTWIPQDASHHITRIVFIVVLDAWYVFFRVREVRRLRAAS